MSGSNPKPEEQQTAPDLGVLLGCVIRHLPACLLLGVAASTAGALVGLKFVPAQYKATSMIRLGGPEGVISKPNESSNAQREFRHTQQELLKMPHVLRRALEASEVVALGTYNPATVDLEDLAEALVLDLPRSSEILRISVLHDRAENAYLLTNAITDSYLEEIQRGRESTVEKRITTLDRLQTTTEEQLGDAWQQLQALARQLGSGDPTSLSLQSQAEIENYRAYSRHLRELRGERREAERLVESIRLAPETLSREMPEDASMHSVRYAMFQAKFRREEAEKKLGPDHPTVAKARSEEEALQAFYQKTAA